MTIYKHMNILREKLRNHFLETSTNKKYWMSSVGQFKKSKLCISHTELWIDKFSKRIPEVRKLNKYRMIMIFLHYLEPINYGKKIRKIKNLW